MGADRARWGAAALLAGLVAAGSIVGCSGDDSATPSDAGASGDGATFVAVDVETVAPERVTAGVAFSVSCLLIDAAGETHTPAATDSPALHIEPSESVERTGDGSIVATRVGTLEVACRFPSLGLADTTPALVAVDPGAPVRVSASVDRDALVAGDMVDVTCEAVDTYGNIVPDAETTVRADPPSPGNTFEGHTGTFEHAGAFDVECDLAGAESRGARVVVTPGLPASLLVSLVPDRPVYAVGEVIELARAVADRFGNPIAAAVVPVTSAPPAAAQLGEARFRYASDGRYTLTATVSPPTEGDVVLTESVEVVIDSNGPAIDCASPGDGAILDLAPGTSMMFAGSVNDLSGVTSVRVNGAAAALDPSGGFTAPVTTRFGVNFVDIAAVDGTGREATRTCAFLVADQWASESSALAGSVSLRLRQTAIDDGSRSGAINSLADLLGIVLNGAGLRSALHAALLAANPLKPSSCDQSVFGVCVLRSEVLYISSQLNGPNTATLTLVSGGLRAHVDLRDTRVQLRVRGQVAGIPYDSTGWATFSSIAVDAIFDTTLSSGRPRISVRPGSVTTTVGSISTSFSGLDGLVIDIVATLANGTLRSMVSSLVSSWVRDNFNSVLDSVVGGLDISTLGASFDVPRLDGTGTIRVSFTPSFTSLSTTTSRVLFGLGTRLSAPAAHARPSLGAPIPPGAVLLDPPGTTPAAVALNVAVLDQAVHALWRGGLFDAALDATSVSGLPAGVRATLRTQLPPAVALRSDGRVELSLGAIGLDLEYPALFSEPLAASLGARASMRVTLTGDVLSFDDFRLEELHLSTDAVSLDTTTRTTLEGLLTRVLGHVVGDALNDALPAVPIPAFEIPASLGTYGLPVGASIGLVSPSLSTTGNHFMLAGGFGVR